MTSLDPRGNDHYRPATELQYGKSGLAGYGGSWLTVQYDFGTPVTILGVECDYTVIPYTVKVGDNYEQEVITSKGCENSCVKTLDEKITVQKVQVEWPNTGKPWPAPGTGFHFQFLGCDESSKFWDTIENI